MSLNSEIRPILEPLDIWVTRLTLMPLASTAIDGVINLSEFVFDMMLDLRPIFSIAPIFVFNKILFQETLLPLFAPVGGNAWIEAIIFAWEIAMLTSVIVPGTVLLPDLWTISFNDVLTTTSTFLTTGLTAITIINILEGKDILKEGLLACSTNFLAGSFDKALEIFAKAFREAAKALKFLVIGIADVGGNPVPIPILLPTIPFIIEGFLEFV